MPGEEVGWWITGRDGSKSPRPPSRAATTQLDDLGPPLSGSTGAKIEDYLASSWPVLRMSEQPPQAHARKKSRTASEKSGASGCGCWVGSSGSSSGRGLRRAMALGPIIIRPARGRRALRSPAAGGREDALTCSSVADARAYLARPPRLSRRPGSHRRQPGTTWSRAANHGARPVQSILGGKAEPGRLCSKLTGVQWSWESWAVTAVDVALQSQVTRPPFQFPIGSFPQILCWPCGLSQSGWKINWQRDCSVNCEWK